MRHHGLCAASLAVLTSEPVLWNTNLIDEVSTASMVEAGAAIGRGGREPFLFRGPPGPWTTSSPRLVPGWTARDPSRSRSAHLSTPRPMNGPRSRTDRAQEVHAQSNTAANVEEIRDGELAAAIDRAVRGARRRLQRAECARVFDDFSDGDGRSLSSVLETTAWPRSDPASRAIFRDGREHMMCRTSPVAAFTGPGSRVVFVCGNRFGRIGRERAELIIIHELLHTLGLREQPPTPGEIDQAVARRCGS